MRCDSQASLLARTFTSPCFGHEAKVRVATLTINGSEFTSKKFISFFSSHKIQYQFPTPYTLQQNYVVEMMNGMIVEITRYMFHHGKSWLYIGQK
jgi:transposase InsO family protein